MASRSEVEEAADQLYALSPREFTAARDARAKEAKDAGDKEAAAEIKALRKPTVTAWLANQLVRQHADEVRPLLELGSALREATATLSGPQLRELSRQRNDVVRALVRQARRLAADAGQPVSEDVARGLEETLNAALADPGQAELLLQGRLSVQLKHSGYGPAEGSSSAAGKPPAAPDKAKQAAGGRQPTAAEQRRAERRDQLERELAEAWPAARAAADAGPRPSSSQAGGGRGQGPPATGGGTAQRARRGGRGAGPGDRGQRAGHRGARRGGGRG